jgi:antitoxin component of RelBE/YafQ-DinJ toxin-antitoxin module
MAEAISVRLDDEAEQALRTLEATGLTRSEAIRSALVKAAQTLRNRNDLVAEVAVLRSLELGEDHYPGQADPGDRG